jgi:hypothetical protein
MTEGGETLKRNILFFVSLVAAVFVFAGTTIAETYQIRSRNQNQNQIQNRRYKQNLDCQFVKKGKPGDASGEVSECNGDGLTIKDGNGGTVVVYGLGPVSYWNESNVVRPVHGETVFVTFRTVTFSDESTKNILFSLSYGTDYVPDIQLRDEESGCPKWRPM